VRLRRSSARRLSRGLRVGLARVSGATVGDMSLMTVRTVSVASAGRWRPHDAGLVRLDGPHPVIVDSAGRVRDRASLAGRVNIDRTTGEAVHRIVDSGTCHQTAN
jgi:hypothetical protein